MALGQRDFRPRLPQLMLPGLVLLCLALVACGDDVVLPAARPLVADTTTIDSLPGAATGPLAVSSARDRVLPGDDAHPDLSVNLHYPTTGGPYPLLLFSHGNWSDKDSYDRVIQHWVSHGYSVIAPNHLDCCSAVRGIFNSLRHGQLGLIQGRVGDLQRLIDELPTLERLYPEFAGKADPSRLALTGHSFGAFSAQQFGGAMAFDPDTEQYLPVPHPGVRAIVALSPPGPMFTTITAGSWAGLSVPTLVTTGTWDIQPSFWPDWRMHLMSWETAQPGDKYALVTEGADHYLGTLICRLERDEAPQEDALRMVQLTSTTFLDAYLKNDAAALAFLTSGRLDASTGNFARLAWR